MSKTLLPLLVCLIGLAGCSKPPEIAGLYTKKASLGRHGGTAEVQWDFRSDGTVTYYAQLDFAQPTMDGKSGKMINRVLQYAVGKWKRESGEVVFTGQVTSVNDGSGDDVKLDTVAKFKLEPNGDLIGASGDVPWLTDEDWYPMRYAKQR
jgi:hypothetical protein